MPPPPLFPSFSTRHRYIAKLTAPKSGSGYTGVHFQMTVPTGATLRSYKAAPRASAAPAFTTVGAATSMDWTLGNIRAGKSVRVMLKLQVPNTCTTPLPLALDGRWVVDGTTYGIPLKKPLYVTSKGCAPVPPQNKTKPIKF